MAVNIVNVWYTYQTTNDCYIRGKSDNKRIPFERAVHDSPACRTTPCLRWSSTLKAPSASLALRYTQSYRTKCVHYLIVQCKCACMHLLANFRAACKQHASLHATFMPSCAPSCMQLAWTLRNRVTLACNLRATCVTTCVQVCAISMQLCASLHSTAIKRLIVADAGVDENTQQKEPHSPPCRNLKKRNWNWRVRISVRN